MVNKTISYVFISYHPADNEYEIGRQALLDMFVDWFAGKPSPKDMAYRKLLIREEHGDHLHICALLVKRTTAQTFRQKCEEVLGPHQNIKNALNIQYPDDEENFYTICNYSLKEGHDGVTIVDLLENGDRDGMKKILAKKKVKICSFRKLVELAMEYIPTTANPTIGGFKIYLARAYYYATNTNSIREAFEQVCITHYEGELGRLGRAD